MVVFYVTCRPGKEGRSWVGNTVGFPAFSPKQLVQAVVEDGFSPEQALLCPSLSPGWGWIYVCAVCRRLRGSVICSQIIPFFHYWNVQMQSDRSHRAPPPQWVRVEVCTGSTPGDAVLQRVVGGWGGSLLQLKIKPVGRVGDLPTTHICSRAGAAPGILFAYPTSAQSGWSLWLLSCWN